MRGLAEGYHQKILDSGQVLQVEAHLSECPSCRKAYEETREVLALLTKDVLPDPGPAFWNELNSRILTQVRLSRPEGDEDPWYKKFWIKPFGWPGYAWATALLLMLLTPVVLYNITFQGNHTALIQENIDQENKWETRPLPLPVVVENLSDTESVRLAKRVMARMGKDLSSPTGLLLNEDLHWDISRSLEGLNRQELEALINKMGPGGSAGNKEEGEYVC
jgi:predicted anti-sigma-YlaC factor YlaD